MSKNDEIMFEGTVESRTGKAVLFQSDYWEKAEWLPLSQCRIEPDPENQGRATVYVREWLVKKNGWNY